MQKYVLDDSILQCLSQFGLIGFAWTLEILNTVPMSICETEKNVLDNIYFVLSPTCICSLVHCQDTKNLLSGSVDLTVSGKRKTLNFAVKQYCYSLRNSHSGTHLSQLICLESVSPELLRRKSMSCLCALII